MSYTIRVPFRDSDGKVFRTSDDKIFRVKKDIGGFTLELYTNTAESQRVDKTNYLTSVGSLTGTLKEECSLLTPLILINADGLPNFNYVKIPNFNNRYYFVTEIVCVRTGLWRISLRVDVLMTYKTGIGGLTGLIGRQENDYNEYLIDNRIITETTEQVEYINVENDVLSFGGNPDVKRYVFLTLGQESIGASKASANEEPSNAPANSTSREVHYPAIQIPYLVGIHALSFTQINAMYDYITTDTFVDDIRLLFTDPIQNITGVICFPFDVTEHSYAGSDRAIHISNLNTHVQGAPILTHMKILDMGTVTISEHFESFMDYAPFTKIEVFLPYCGFLTLDTNLVMGKTLKFEYGVDITSGKCTAYVEIVEGTGSTATKTVIQSIDGTIGHQIPIGGTSGAEFGRAIFNTGFGLAGNAIGMATSMYGMSQTPMKGGGTYGETPAYKGRAIGGTAGFLNNTMLESVDALHEHVVKGGSSTPVTAMYDPQNVYVIITRPTPINPAGIESLDGKPSGEMCQLSSLTGFTAVEKIHVEGIDATETEVREIESQLLNGVIL